MVNPRVRLIGAWVLLAVSVIGWPLSALTFAKDEPATVLGLSWFAITMTALDILITTSVRNEQDDES